MGKSDNANKAIISCVRLLRLKELYLLPSTALSNVAALLPPVWFCFCVMTFHGVADRSNPAGQTKVQSSATRSFP